jgi:hypothetical protein
MCEPRCLTTLWAFTGCYRESYTFYSFGIWILFLYILTSDILFVSAKWCLNCECIYVKDCHGTYEGDFDMEHYILFSCIDLLLILVVLHTFCMLCSIYWSILPPHPLPCFLLLVPHPPSPFVSIMFTSVYKVKLYSGKESLKVPLCF